METSKIRGFRRLLRRFERLTTLQLREDSGCQGVTPGQCHVILEIEALAQATTQELSRALDLDKSTLSRTIDGLVNIGLVQRSPHPQDRRSILLSLSTRGAATADRINQANDDYFARVFQRIPVERHDRVIRDFELLTSALQTEKGQGAGNRGRGPGVQGGQP